MRSESILVLCDVYCKWSGTSPIYRCYINDELFSERTWIWNDVYLEENLQVTAPPGKYDVKIELLDSAQAGIKVRNLRIGRGPAIITPQGQVQIYTPESTTQG